MGRQRERERDRERRERGERERERETIFILYTIKKKPINQTNKTSCHSSTLGLKEVVGDGQVDFLSLAPAPAPAPKYAVVDRSRQPRALCAAPI